MDTNSFIVCIKSNYIHKNIAKDVETRFDTTNYELKWPLLKAMNENVVGVMKNKLGKKIMKKFVRLIPKTYSYLIDNSSEDKKAKGTK